MSTSAKQFCGYGAAAAVEMTSMRSGIRISTVIVGFILSGCSVNTNSRMGDDPPIWGRADCQRGEGNPELLRQFDDAKAACLARGEREEAVAGTAGSSPCMIEQGYVLRTRAEHEAACRGQPQNDKSATRTKNPTPKSARPTTTLEPTVPAAPGRQ
jgi:hypothetical protein